MNLRNALMAVAVLVAPFAIAPSTAQAQPLNGVYIGAGAGVNFLTNTNIRPPGTGTRTSRIGVVGLGSIGYGFGNGLRVELEGNFRNQTVRTNGATATHQSFGPMLNVLYDMDIGTSWASPYIGVGAGAQFGRVRGGGITVNQNVAAAAQGILGVAFPIADVPGLAITTEARVISTLANVRYTNAGNTANTAPQLQISGLIGLRYAFGVVAPAPVAAPAAVPAPAPARTYLVFFEWDKSDLSPRARQIIADAATASTAVATTRIEVGGHADRTGTASYNQQISMRRATAVAAELVRLGVARNAISINAFGETKPLVATAANTREPQNRRVEIVLK